MTLLSSINHPARIHDIRFSQVSLENDVLMVAAEDKRVTIYSLERLAEGDPVDGPDDRISVLCYLDGHTNRYASIIPTMPVMLNCRNYSVKGLDVLSFQDATYVTTVSSDGRIHLYEVSTNSLTVNPSNRAEPPSFDPLVAYDTKGSRLTCVTIVEGRPDIPNGSLGQKRDRGQSSDEDDDQ